MLSDAAFRAFLSLSGLSDSKEKRKQIVQHVLDWCRNEKNDFCQKLQVSLRTVTVPGFRRGKVPPALLIQLFCEFEQFQPGFTELVMKIWISACEEKVKRVIAVKEVKQGLELLKQSGAINSPEVSKHFNELTHSASTALRDISTEDIRIILAFKILVDADGDLNADGVEEREDVTCADGMSDFWKAILDRVKALPEDCTEWEQCDLFIDEIRTVQAEKRQAAIEKKKALLQEHAKLLEECRKVLGYTGVLDKVAGFKTENCPSEAANIAETILRDLRLQAQKFEEMNPAGASTFMEEAKRLQRRSELKNEMERLADELAKLGSGSQLKSRASLPSKANGPDPSSAHTMAPVDVPLDSSSAAHAEEAGKKVDEEPSGTEPSENGSKEETEPGSSVKPSGPATVLKEPEAGRVERHGDSQVPSEVGKRTLRKATNQSEMHALACRMVKEGDLAGGYWVCRSLEHANEPAPFQSQLLAALQGSFWLMPSSDYFVSDMNDLAESFKPLGGQEEELLRLATALAPTFLTQSLIYADWLITPSLLPQANDLIDGLREFLAAGVVLSPDDFKGMAGEIDRESRIAESINEAKSFMLSAPNKRTAFWRANDLWRRLMEPDGQLGRLIGIAAGHRKEGIEELKQAIVEWEGADRLTRKIRSCERELGRARLPDIVGPARQHLLSNIEECIFLCRKWIRAVEQETSSKSRDGNWISRQISTFRKALEVQLPKIQVKLMGLLEHEGAVQASAACLLRALYSFQKHFEINAIKLDAGFADVRDWKWLRQGTYDLQVALGNRLLWVSEVQLDESRQPIAGQIHQVGALLAASERAADGAEDRLQRWLANRDFRFKDIFLQSIGQQDDHIARRKIDDEELRCREDLKAMVMEAATEIEQMFVDGIIAEERSKFTGDLLAIVPERTRNFRVGFKKIEDLKSKIEAARGHRMAELEKRWNATWAQLSASQMDPTKRRSIETFVTQGIKSGDTRVVEESLSQLDGYLVRGIEPEEAWFQGKADQDTLSEFIGRLDRLNAWLAENRDFRKVVAELERRKKILDIDFSEVIKIRRHQIADIFTTWGELKYDKPKAALEARKKVVKILRFLGFLINPDKEGWGVKDRMEANWWHGRVEMLAGDLARPFPQFGSQAHGVYDVVCFWGQPEPGVIASNLSALGLENKCVIAIFFGSLSASQRSHIVRNSHENKLAMAVLDEALLVNLARNQETRLSGLLRCSLPFAAVNPYEPFKAGDVAPEMFFGRKEMARQLEDPGKSCFVFGGRQLGKSAMLRHVERNFHHPEREQYAKVEDIKLIGDPGADQFTSSLFERLRDIFKGFKLLNDRITTAKPEEIFKYLRAVMMEKPQRRVLILLDEADNFLESDAKDNFRVVDQIRILMADTGRRFKVVFTGLHSVQRYQGIPNQPLAHFGSPICVGPLEPKDARQLVVEPLSALGFKLDDATVLRILSYTNYHPGLIQLFCHKLLSLLQSRYKDELPPYTVARELVDSVYRNEEVYRSIRDRFDWTLALDRRYQAIAWSLILEQMDDNDSYAQSFSIVQILELVRSHWKNGFQDTDMTFLRSLLDEMVGLGVLMWDKQDRYRLRSPNLVRIMGTQDDVLARLDELSNKETLPVSAVDHYHVPLDSRAIRFSPLTHAQERILNKNVSGAAIVFASQALGLNELGDTFKRFLRSGAVKPGDPEDVTRKVASAEDLQEFLNDLWHKQAETRILVTFGPKALPGAELLRIAEEAKAFTEKRKSAGRWLRMVFVLDPDSGREWFRLDRAKRSEFEQAVGGAIYPRKLDIPGIRQRLALSTPEKVHSDAACEKVKLATGGWPYLVDQFMTMCLGETDPQPVAKEFNGSLMHPKSELAAGFSRALGLNDKTDEWLLIKLLIGFGDEEIPVDFLQEYVDSEASQLSERCLDMVEYLRRFGIVDLLVDSLKVDPIVKALCSRHGT
jgi:hypothetical protein